MEAAGPSTTSTVSASGIEAIETTIEVTPQVQISEVPLEEVYEVDRTVLEVKRGGWTKVDAFIFIYKSLHTICLS